ncbi:SDR family NAD(P)-dependent oxidoreductase [Promicromonospora sp. MEB111]|uniref:SDR family NAD(P)-dependent oxidoreductase n=1 Tax=Promicromonospora sp. MEB111 TaxID=3040301 RepID=UPI00254CA2AD|nr:SDR family NAD(P)-dependent oxidoreductase [Promicromonospora sp. MEB111]
MGTSLDGKVALVTGASSGIGKEVALSLSRQGALVVAGARRADRLAELEAVAPGRIRAVSLDVTDRSSVQAAVDVAVSEFGSLDLLVNNAGVMLVGPVLGADTEDWARMIATNLMGSMHMIHAALPHLLASKGTVIQTSSTSGRIASAGSSAYAATKFGVNAFVEALRKEVTTQGVRVVVIEPGFTASELTSHIPDPRTRAMADQMASSMRTLQPEDIAGAVIFAATQPHHVSVSEILVRPTDQEQ